MTQLPPEVVYRILSYLPTRTRDAVYNKPNQSPEYPQEYEVGIGFQMALERSFVSYKKYGELHPRTCYPTIENFVEAYNSPPYMPNPKSLKVNIGIFSYEYTFPDVYHLDSSFKTKPSPKLVEHDLSTNPLLFLDPLIKEIGHLTCDYDSFDDSTVDKYSVKELTVLAGSKFSKLQNTKVPLNLLINNPISKLAGLPQNLTSLRLPVTEDLKDIDLSYLPSLETLNLCLDYSVTDFDMKPPKNLKSLFVSCSDEVFYSGSDFLPSTLKHLQFQLFYWNHELPKGIEELDLLICEANYDIPEGVKSLTLESCIFEDVVKLPTSLEKLHIINCGSFPEDLLNLVNLKHLNIEVDDVPTIGSSPDRPILLPDNLTTLKCSTDLFFVLNDQLVDIALITFPESTKSLPATTKYIEIGQTTYENIKNLPSNLEQLQLFCVNDTTGEPFTIPPSTKNLSIYSSDVGNLVFNEGLQVLSIEGCVLNQSLIDKLPKTIKVFALNHNIFNEKTSLDFSKFEMTEFAASTLINIEQLVFPSTLKAFYFTFDGDGFIDYGVKPDYSRVKDAIIVDEPGDICHHIANGKVIITDPAGLNDSLKNYTL